MSYIGHRCTRCQHPDIWRLASGRGAGASPRCDLPSCGCRCTPDPVPAVRPTFGLDGKPVERIVEPGQKITAGIPTCGCEACQALYAELTGAAA